MRQGIDELYNALVHVVARRGLQQSPLFLTGESLGGTYMPLLAQRILDGQKQRSTHIRLGGVIIAAGFVDPLVQVSTTAQYAYAHGLIDARQKATLDRVLARCRRLMRGGPPSSPEATNTCYSIQSKIADWSGRYLANIGQTGDIDYGPLLHYVNRPDVRRALHAQPTGKFSLSLRRDRQGVRARRHGLLPQRRRGAAQPRGAGDGDHRAQRRQGHQPDRDAQLDLTMRWRGAAQVPLRTAAPVAEGKTKLVLGYVQRGGGLTTLDVVGAGHLAVRDQPKILDQVVAFMKGAGR